jgi:predicted Holliday junction resolvase-like endonuclease
MFKKMGKTQTKNIQLEATLDSKIKKAVVEARADSTKRQRSILKGQATEQLAPYINNNYNPKDYKFMGDPIDYIIFDGMSDLNTKEDEIKKIILMDIKTGKSQLNKVQKAVKRCIEAGGVEFQVYRPEKDIEQRLENEDIQSSK